MVRKSRMKFNNFRSKSALAPSMPEAYAQIMFDFESILKDFLLAERPRIEVP